MKLWVITINGEVFATAYTALSEACKEMEVSVSTARDKRIFLKKNPKQIIEFTQVEVSRIKKKGGNFGKV